MSRAIEVSGEVHVTDGKPALTKRKLNDIMLVINHLSNIGHEQIIATTREESTVKNTSFTDTTKRVTPALKRVSNHFSSTD